MAPRTSKKKKGDLLISLRILAKHLRDHKKEIIFLSVIGLVGALANGAVPFVMGKFLDSLLSISSTITFFNYTLPLWLAILLLWICVQLIANTVGWISDYKGRVLRLSMRITLHEKGYAHLLFLPLSYHKDKKIGEVTGSLERASWQIATIADNILTDVAPQFLSVIVGIAITFLINPYFTAILLLGVAIYVLILIKTVGPTAHLLEEGHDKWNEADADAMQFVGNIQTVKHMASEELEKKKMHENFSNLLSIWRKIDFMWSGVNSYQRFLVLATQTSIFILSIYFIQNGTLTVGELVAVNGYAGLLFGPFVQLGYSWQTLQNGLVSIRKVDETIFAHTHENYHPKNAYTPSTIEGNIVFSDVSFSYDKKSPLLEHISFSAHKGERMALVGKSGVGKSTTIELISGYYFPQKGSVTVDGHSTRTFDLTALRSHIAVVPQEPVLFNDTILMNLLYARPSASKEEVVEAAKKAEIHEFIETLPLKYKQLVGERGVKLSVGQKQRIAIARAILRDPAILILDEPTSALDAETERLITGTLETLMEGRTTFIIAHRLSTVRKANKILVFEKGSIVETGTHEELIQKEGGAYKSLYDYQIGLH